MRAGGLLVAVPLFLLAAGSVGCSGAARPDPAKAPGGPAAGATVAAPTEWPASSR